MRTMKSVSMLTTAVAFFGICAVLCCTAALAQGGPPQAVANQDKAWELEAKTVAQGLALPAESTAKLVDAYKAARASHQTAIREKMGQQQGGRPDFSAMMAVTDAEKAKLETALKGFLNPEQTTKALAALGTFSRRWDPMVAALDALNLEDKAKAEAMKTVMDYVVESDAVMRAAITGNDRDSLREKSGAMREKLDANMAKILPADQLAKWKEATAMTRGGRRQFSGPAPAAPAPTPAPAPPAAPAPESKPPAK